MKWSLLNSDLLLVIVLSTMAYGNSETNYSSPTSATETSFHSGLNETNSLSVDDSTSHASTVSVAAPEQTTKVTSEVTKTALITTTTPAKNSKLPVCDCLLNMENNHSLLVMGGLTLGCVILLITTLALACHVCQLKRHFRDYELCHVETSTANGKKRASGGHEPDERTIMMSEVSKDDETTRDSAEDDKCKETKEESDVNTGADQSSKAQPDATDSDKPAVSGTSEVDKGPASEAKPVEGGAGEAKDVTNGPKNEAKEEAEEPTKANAEAAAAPEGSGSEA